MRSIVLTLALAVGCGSPPTGPYQTPKGAERDTQTAERLTREAADLLHSDLEKAEALLREALSADLFYGQAHNNLGVVFLEREELYEAAHEFEWARKLLPGHPDPRVNLALTLDRAGRAEDALEAYETALEVTPGYMPAIQGLARLAVREGQADPRLAGWLGRIAIEGKHEGWREWAKRAGALGSATPRPR